VPDLRALLTPQNPSSDPLALGLLAATITTPQHRHHVVCALREWRGADSWHTFLRQGPTIQRSDVPPWPRARNITDALDIEGCFGHARCRGRHGERVLTMVELIQGAILIFACIWVFAWVAGSDSVPANIVRVLLVGTLALTAWLYYQMTGAPITSLFASSTLSVTQSKHDTRPPLSCFERPQPHPEDCPASTRSN